MAAIVLNLPVSLYQQAPEGEFNGTPNTTMPHAASSNTIQFYLGGLPTAGLGTFKLIFESLDGTVTDTRSATADAAGMSATYTTVSTDPWLATAGVTFKVRAQVTRTGDTSGPGASAIQYFSKSVLITTS